MSALIQLIDISFTHGETSLFQHLNLTINQRQKIGLVGYNGCGKSTLMSLITSKQLPDSGEVRRAGHVKLGHVDQFVSEKLSTLTAIEVVLNGLAQDEIATNRWQAECQLASLGFVVEQFEQPLNSMSGGEQNLVLIARALISKPDLLLMDEPGNHMDLKAMLTLENFLKSECQCAVLMISHDWQLLDSVCEQTVFVRDQKCYSFDLAYSDAKLALDKMDQESESRRKVEEKEIVRLQKTAKRLAVWGHQYDNEDLSRKSKSILKRVDKLQDTKTFVSQGSGLKLTLEDQHISAKQILAIDNLNVMTPDGKKYLLTIDGISIKPGDRVALLGENGCGKSTSLELIRKQFLTEDNNAGAIRFNPRAELGYFEQELNEFHCQLTRIEWLRSKTNVDEEALKRALINAGVNYRAFDRKVNSLSGGEKARMVFLVFSLNQPNLMILDEPTNHIDLQGKQELTQQLMESGATLIITSHDRHFLDNLITRWFCIENQKLVEVNGPENFYDRLLNGKPKQVKKRADSIVPAVIEEQDELLLLLKIEELEQKLEADLKRKAKFQKPELQRAWQEELALLWSKLG